MLFTSTVHIALIALGVLGTVAMGLGFRKQQIWPAILLWLVPCVLTASVSDLALRRLATWWPVAAMDGGEGDWLRFAGAAIILLPPVEILYQRATTVLAGGGVHHFRADGAEDRS